MAKAPQSDLIMAADKMRPMLVGSKKEPVHAAFGLTAEGDAVLLLDRKAAPRKVMTMLRASAEKAKLKLAGPSVRFGRAEVDPENEPGLVRVFINKEGSDALRMKLTEVVKRIAYQRVEFTVDPSLEMEAEGDAAVQPAAEAAPAPPASADRNDLRHRLAGAVGAIAGVADPARKTALSQLAAAANAALKAGNESEATRLIQAIETAAHQTPKPGAPAGAPDKLLALFRDAKEDVDAGLTKLQQALLATGDEDLKRIADFGLYGMTEGTGVGLMKALFELRSATPESRQTRLAAAREAAKAYRTAVFADGAIDLVDDNPFGVVVGIRAKLGPALDAIANAA